MTHKLINGVQTYLAELRLLTPNARKYLLGSFFIGMTYASFQLLLNLYLREKGCSEGFIGSVLSAGAIGTALVCIPGAIILSRIRLKAVLTISTLLYMASGLITIYTDSKEIIWLSFLCGGMMLTFYRIAAAPFFMRNSSPIERPYLFSLSFGISVVAGVVGSFLFGRLVEYFAGSCGTDSVWAHRLALTVGISFSLLALIPFGLIRTPNSISSEDSLEISKEIIRKVRRPFLRLALPYFLVGAGAGMIIPFLNLFFRDRFGQSPQEIGFYYGMVNLTMFIGVMAGPVLVRKFGMVRTLVYTQLLSIPFMLVLAFSYSFPLVIFAFLMRGGLMNMGQPIGTNFAMEMVPKAYHGLLNAFLSFAWMSSWMVAAQVGGLVIEKYGYSASLLVAVGMYVLSTVLYYLYFRRAERFTPDGIMISADYRMLG